MKHLPYLYKFFSSKRFTFLCGCIIGAIVFLSIYGVRVLDVTYDTWLLNSYQTESLWDLSQHYIGWLFFRKSPWHFPLGVFDGLYDGGMSIAYTDSIPLFAIIFKILSPLLPETFQYFGLFQLLCYVFMGGFASLIIHRFSCSPIFSLSAALIFSLSPVMLRRAFYHTALSAHFLILAAFCLWIYRDTFIKRSSYNILWIILCIGSASINAYFTPMIIGILCCSLLQEFIENKRFSPVFCTGILSVLCTMISAYLLGYFFGHNSAESYGLGQISFNLLGFINPSASYLTVDKLNYTFSSLNYSKLLPALPTTNGFQDDGFSYLGLGMILFVLITIFARIGKYLMLPKSARQHICTRHGVSYMISGLVCFIGFIMLAASPYITVGSHTIVTIPYPTFILRLLSIFRSSGRLIWPAYYGLIIVVFIALIKLHKTQKHTWLTTLFICATIILQLIDLSPAYVYKHNVYTDNYASDMSPLNSDAWDLLGSTCDKIVFYSPIEYTVDCDPKDSCIFAVYAYKHHMALNASYTSRSSAQTADLNIARHFSERSQGNIFPDTLYIFSDLFDVPPAAETHLNYYLIDGYIIGTDQDLSSYDVTQYNNN